MTEQKLKERKERVLKILEALHGLFPDVRTELNYSTPWELLVAVQLSAQSTDVQVNKLTNKLFNKYPKFSDYLKADPKIFEKDISSVNFYRNKAKNILGAGRVLHEKFGDKMPETMDKLLELPGLARKSANVILGQIFGKAEGIVVDTHVTRLSQKLELTEHKDAVRIEKDLMEIVPKSQWIFFGNALVWYGRKICQARVHECADHPLTKIYPVAATIWPKK